uniref:Non-specific serine/threonine protein kinase n=1 Tax=Panagrellus redivivus TaxID=6233 RepID=A0A7E4WAC3_PANRE
MAGGKPEQIDEYYYYKEDLIGHGAFAIVYKGIDTRKNTNVAIKAIAKKNIAKAKNLLTKEIRILKELSTLKHENLVSLLKCVETASHVFLVMEFCNGGDLADYLQMKTTLSESTIQHFFMQIAHALKAMHAKGIVHRDLKPQNILLCRPPGEKNPSASDLVVKLADFGFARFLNDGVMAGTLCGSPMYMAPEVIMSKQYDAKADLWSIGTIIFQCLTGKAPFVEKTPQALKLFYERNKDPFPKIPDSCSEPLRDLLIRLLKRNAKDRIEFDDFFIHPFLVSPLPTPKATRRIDSHYTSSPRASVVPSSVPASTAYGYGTPQPSRGRTTTETRNSPRPSSLQRNYSNVERAASVRGTAYGAGQGTVAAGATNAPQKPMMSDSSEFTFLPPLDKRGQTRQQQQHIQYSNGTQHSIENPVKQVQVHASHVRAVPVPSQRTNYTIMEQRRNSSKSPVSPHRHPSEPAVYMPNIENISVPDTKFIVRDPPPSATNASLSAKNRRYTATDLSACTKEEPESRTASPAGPVSPTIPKSATSTTPLFDKTDPKLNPPVDNIQFLSTSPSRTSAAATVKILSPMPAKLPTFSSDEEDEGDDFGGNGGNLQSSSSQMMESASGNETGTTTSSGVYSAAVRAKSQNDRNGPSQDSPSKPVFGIDPPAELDPETLLEGDHHRILSKLQFIAEFIETLVSVADNIANPIAMVVEGSRRSNDTSDVYRRSEQIVLYVRAMYILTSALNFSEQQIGSRNLHPSPKVKHVLNQLNDKYHYCLTRSQELASLGIAGGSPTTSVVSAERIMYRHALDLCQSAALDELFGNPHLCPKRYQTAYMMLHTLSEQVQNEQDRSILARYKSAVEKRLRILEGKGLVTAVANN